MGLITASGAGNWSSTTPDAPWPGGTMPGAGDDVSLASFVVTWDAGAGATITIKSLTHTTGYLSVPLGTVGNVTLNITTGNITTATGTSGVINTSSTSSNRLTINFSAGYAVAGTATNAVAIVLAGVNNGLTVNAPASSSTALLGGSAGNTFGLYVNANGASVIVSGKCQGGSSTASYGIYNNGNGGVTITGDLVAGSSIRACGLYQNSSGATTLTGNIIDSAQASGFFGGSPTWNAGKQYYASFGGVKYGPEPTAAQLLTGIVCGDVTGNYHEATVAEVQDGVMFGPDSAYEGEYVGGGGGTKFLSIPGCKPVDIN